MTSATTQDHQKGAKSTGRAQPIDIRYEAEEEERPDNLSRGAVGKSSSKPAGMSRVVTGQKQTKHEGKNHEDDSRLDAQAPAVAGGLGRMSLLQKIREHQRGSKATVKEFNRYLMKLRFEEEGSFKVLVAALLSVQCLDKVIIFSFISRLICVNVHVYVCTHAIMRIDTC